MGVGGDGFSFIEILRKSREYLWNSGEFWYPL